MRAAQRIARAGPSNVARTPSPATSTRASPPWTIETGVGRRPRSDRACDSSGRSPSSLACSVEPTTSTKSTVARTRSASSTRVREPGDELLDRADEIRVRKRPVVGAVELDEPRTGDVLGEVAPVTDADVRVVAAVDARASAPRRAGAHRARRARSIARAFASAVPRRCRESLDSTPPFDDSGPVGDRRRRGRGERARPPLSSSSMRQAPARGCAAGMPARIVVVARETGEAVVEHERRHRSGCVAAAMTAICTAWPCATSVARSEPAGVHDGDDVVHPVLGAAALRGTGSRHPDAAHVEPEHARERASDRRNSSISGCSPEHLEMARPVEDEDEVDGPSPKTWYAMLDVAAAARTACAASAIAGPRGCRGGPVRARSPRRAT